MPVWLLATLRLLILLYVVAEIVVERYTTRERLQTRQWTPLHMQSAVLPPQMFDVPAAACYAAACQV